MSGIRCQVLCVRCQVSGVRCQVSGVRRNVSGFTLFFICFATWASRWRVFYQRIPPHNFFFYKKQPLGQFSLKIAMSYVVPSWKPCLPVDWRPLTVLFPKGLDDFQRIFFLLSLMVLRVWKPAYCADFLKANYFARPTFLFGNFAQVKGHKKPLKK